MERRSHELDDPAPGPQSEFSPVDALEAQVEDQAAMTSHIPGTDAPNPSIEKTDRSRLHYAKVSLRREHLPFVTRQQPGARRHPSRSCKSGLILRV